MTKQETYDELVKRGATLNPVASYKADELKALLAATPEPGASSAGNAGNAGSGEVPPADPVKEKSKKFPVLRFPGSGWCNEIGFSYTKGLFRPKTAREYEALRKYAVEEIAQ